MLFTSRGVAPSAPQHTTLGPSHLPLGVACLNWLFVDISVILFIPPQVGRGKGPNSTLASVFCTRCGMRRPRVPTQLATLLSSITSFSPSQPRPFFYTPLPAYNSPPFGAAGSPESWRSRRLIVYRSKAVRLTLSFLLLLTLFATGVLLSRRRPRPEPEPFDWVQLER